MAGSSATVSGPRPITRDDLPRRHAPGRSVSARQQLVYDIIDAGAGEIRDLVDDPDTDDGWAFEFNASEHEELRVTSPTAASGTEACRRAIRKAVDRVTDHRDVLDIQYEYDMVPARNGGVIIGAFRANMVRRRGVQINTQEE